jgi:probable F420-dependent oxidoreductase
MSVLSRSHSAITSKGRPQPSTPMCTLNVPSVSDVGGPEGPVGHTWLSGSPTRRSRSGRPRLTSGSSVPSPQCVTGPADPRAADRPAGCHHGHMARPSIDTRLSGLENAADEARRLEALGVDGAFTFEGPHDVFTPLVLAAPATSSLALSTNVAIAFPRNPVQLAHQAYDLQLLSRGRFTLGLGSQVRAQVEKRYGAGFDRPIVRMRELVAALRAVFASWQEGKPLDFRGEFTSHTLMPPTFNPGPNPFGPPPIALGGLGPQMVRLAAEVADGLLVMPFNSARHFRRRTLPRVVEGLARSGRARSSLILTGEVIVCCGRDEPELDAARAAGRWLVAFYASTPAYRPVLEEEGWEQLQPELNMLSKMGRWEEMPHLVDDVMLGTLAAVGSPDEVAADVLSRFGREVDRIAFYTPGAMPEGTLGELVDALGRGDARTNHDGTVRT